MRRVCLTLVLLLATAASAIEITPKNPVPPYQMVHVKPTKPDEIVIILPVTTQQMVESLAGDEIELPTLEVVRTADGEYVFTGPPGQYVVGGYTNQGGVTVGVQKLVRIGSPAPPVPPTPIPIPPTPDPVPPVPPAPDVSPFPAPGLAVLVIREGQEIGKLPASQQAIFSSATVLRYLQEKCVKLSAGDPAVRVWDDDYTDAQIANSPAVMREAYRMVLAQAAGKFPWIAITNGREGFSGPLPLTVADTMTLLQKYGGTP